MSSFFSPVSRSGYRFIRSVTTSVLALSALVVGTSVTTLEAKADPWSTGSLPYSTMTQQFLDPISGISSFDLDPSPVIGDKFVDIMDIDNIRPIDPGAPLSQASTITFSVDTMSALPWHFDLDMFDEGATPAIGPGFISYDIAITPPTSPVCDMVICGPYFEKIGFAASIMGDATAKKTVYDMNGMVVAELFPGAMVDITPLMLDKLLIIDEWDPGMVGSVDNLVNNFSQTPGPLPLLGAGAAFGFSRKLRSRIKMSHFS
jgi:hypothetical protein